MRRTAFRLSVFVFLISACNCGESPSALDWVSTEDPDRASSIYRGFAWEGPYGSTHALGLKIAFDDFDHARQLVNEQHETKFKAAVLWAEKSGITKILTHMAERSDEPVHFTVVNFVQSVKYGTSPVPALLPAHFLATGVGDCDDKSYLAAAILHALDYPVALIVLKDHMALGVVFSDTPGWHFKGREGKYTYWEVTSRGWEPGTMPDEEQKKAKEWGAMLLYPPHK